MLFLGCAPFAARYQEGIKIELQKKVHWRTCVRDITFLTARPPFYVIIFFFVFFFVFFFAFFVYSFHLPKWRTYWMAPIKIHDIVMDSIHSWRYHEWTVKNMKIFCGLILAGCHLQESDIIPDIVTRNG